MKEELIKYVMEKADQCYSDDFPIYSIQEWIREFFDLYQAERLNPEASKIITHPIPDEVKKMFGRCDSPTTEYK